MMSRFIVKNHLDEKNRVRKKNGAKDEIDGKNHVKKTSKMTLKLIRLNNDKKEWRQKVWEIKFH